MLPNPTKSQYFYQQIRDRQKQEVFRKLRNQSQQKHHNSTYESSTVINQINLWLNRSINASLIYENQAELKQLVKKINMNLGEIQDRYQLVLNFLYEMTAVIFNNFSMDEQSSQHLLCSNQEQNKSLETPLSSLLTQVKFVLVNFLAQPDEVVVKHLPSIIKLTKYHIFIDCYHNIFLNTLIQPALKCQFMLQFLKHLRDKPDYFFENCATITRYIYYALFQPPFLKNQQNIYHQIIDRLDSVFGYLQFYQSNPLISQYSQNQFNINAFMVIDKLTNKNLMICMKIMKTQFFMKEYDKKLPQISAQLAENSVIAQKFDDPSNNELYTMKLEYLVNYMKILQNLSFYDEIVYQIFTSYPAIWAHLLRIFYAIGTTKINKKYEKYFNYQKKQIIAEKSLKIIGNLLTNLQIFLDFIEFSKYASPNHNFEEKEIPKAILCLLNIHNYHNRNEVGIQIQTLYIFNNIISGFAHILKDYEYRNDNDSIPTLILLDQITLASMDLTLHIMKITKRNKELLNALLKNYNLIIDICINIQEKRHLNVMGIFNDMSFTAALEDVSESDYQNPSQTQLYAQNLIENLRQWKSLEADSQILYQ